MLSVTALSRSRFYDSAPCVDVFFFVALTQGLNECERRFTAC
jgi:hypothetical protein